MEQIRSFIAIELPEELKRDLRRLQSGLKAGGLPGAKWVDPYSVHLTLKFLGNVAVDKIGEITRAMENAASGVSPFRLEVGSPGAFPNLNRVQVIWVGLNGEVNRLAELQQRLDSALAPLGFASEARAFVPHLTIARLRDGVSPGDRQKFGQLLADVIFDPGFSFEVGDINLMRSQLTREGAVYTRIRSIGLK